jgi:hypothetical protein
VYEGNVKTGVETLKLLPVDRDRYYFFTLKGLTAVNMNDTVRAVVYGTKNGQVYFSPTDEYSIAEYAYSQLNQAASPMTLKVLCADLLRYGAKAQVFKSYRTDALADEAMTDSHRAYLSDVEAVSFGNTDSVLEDLENASVTWAGKALDLESKVALRFVFRLTDPQTDPMNLHLKLSYTDSTGAPVNLSIEDPEIYGENRGLYVFTVDALLAAELRCVVSVQIYEGDRPVSPTLRYCADTYGNGKTGSLLELCKALFAYSDSAKAYFAN